MHGELLTKVHPTRREQITGKGNADTKEQHRPARTATATIVRPPQMKQGDVQIIPGPKLQRERPKPIASYADRLKASTPAPLAPQHQRDKKGDKSGFRKVGENGKATSLPNHLAKRFGVRLDERRLMFTRRDDAGPPLGGEHSAASRVTASINIALHTAGAPDHVRI